MKKSQIWVETVVYTLIGLAIIGVVLAVVKPKIEQSRDKSIIEQTVVMLNDIDEKIKDARFVGDVRIVEVSIKRGKLNILAEEDTLEFVIEDSKYVYSEPGDIVQVGSINVLTKQNKENEIRLWINYDNYDITYNREEKQHVFQKATQPYKIFIENKGSDEKIEIDIRA